MNPLLSHSILLLKINTILALPRWLQFWHRLRKYRIWQGFSTVFPPQEALQNSPSSDNVSFNYKGHKQFPHIDQCRKRPADCTRSTTGDQQGTVAIHTKDTVRTGCEMAFCLGIPSILLDGYHKPRSWFKSSFLAKSKTSGRPPTNHTGFQWQLPMSSQWRSMKSKVNLKSYLCSVKVQLGEK